MTSQDFKIHAYLYLSPYLLLPLCRDFFHTFPHTPYFTIESNIGSLGSIEYDCGLHLILVLHMTWPMCGPAETMHPLRYGCSQTHTVQKSHNNYLHKLSKRLSPESSKKEILFSFECLRLWTDHRTLMFGYLDKPFIYFAQNQGVTHHFHSPISEILASSQPWGQSLIKAIRSAVPEFHWYIETFFDTRANSRVAQQLFSLSLCQNFCQT